MLASLRQPVRQLPLISPDLLKNYDVHEKYDTRFRSCARLLQALWREAHGLPMGFKTNNRARKKRLGSRLAAEAADHGRNFLTPTVADIAALEVTYQERGALIDRTRLFGNLLSSTPLAFNLAAPWRMDPKLGARILRFLLPSIDLAEIEQVWFEHSPNRLDRDFTGDRSALDIAVIYRTAEERRGFIGFEIKYTEDAAGGSPREINDSYDQLATRSGLFKEPAHAALRVSPLQQFFREHLLCFASMAQELYDEAHFVLISPRHNYSIGRAAKLYSAFLKHGEDSTVPFHRIELESAIAAFAAAGDERYATLLYERYCDWEQLDRLICKDINRQKKDWSVQPLRKSNPLALVASAA